MGSIVRWFSGSMDQYRKGAFFGGYLGLFLGGFIGPFLAALPKDLSFLPRYLLALVVATLFFITFVLIGVILEKKFE